MPCAADSRSLTIVHTPSPNVVPPLSTRQSPITTPPPAPLCAFRQSPLHLPIDLTFRYIYSVTALTSIKRKSSQDGTMGYQPGSQQACKYHISYLFQQSCSTTIPTECKSSNTHRYVPCYFFCTFFMLGLGAFLMHLTHELAVTVGIVELLFICSK